MTTTVALRIHAIPPAKLNAVRDSGRDVSGTRVEYLVAEGGEPLRCCLRDAHPGERCMLFGYEPSLPGTATPYREIGPIYAHADECPGPASADDAYPQDWRSRPQVLRAYDARGWIHPATTTHDGRDPVTALQTVLAEPGVVAVHSRNIAYGCFMFMATAA
jgi:hypothetical protein